MPPPSPPAFPPAQGAFQLRDAERVIVRLRWLAMASWPPILLAIDPPVPTGFVWGAYGVALAYVLTTHLLNRSGRAVRATALATTLADPTVTAMICAVTRGIDSQLYPFFYLTTLATSIRFGMAETFAAVLVNASLSVALFLAAPGSTATLSDLAIRIFFLFFVAIEGGLLSRAARHHSRARQEVLQRLMRAEEDERRRLAGELHDRVGRRFFEFFSALDRRRAEVAAKDADTAAELARLADAARGCADEVRAITNELRPVVLDDFGFVEALREHAAALAAEGDLDVSLDVDAPAGAGRRDAGVVLFRALEEALANVRRHADARRVVIRFTAVNGTLELDVRDDGRGFDPAHLPRGHLGLLYMRERVEGYGGRLEIRSWPGAGTELRVIVPASETT
jgi:two-component system NarL family sensor kinase